MSLEKQKQDLNLCLDNEIGLDYLKNKSRRNALIIVEGCSGAGKTTLSDFLSMTMRMPVYSPIDFYNDVSHSWIEHIAISQLYNTKLQIIQDRSMISFCYYHRDLAPTLFGWIENLKRWDFALVIELTSDPEFILKKMKIKGEGYDEGCNIDDIAREIRGFKEMFGYLPKGMLLNYKVNDDNTNKWMHDIHDEILFRIHNISQ